MIIKSFSFGYFYLNPSTFREKSKMMKKVNKSSFLKMLLDMA